MASPRRIAFVCPRFADGSTLGGAEALLKSLAVRLSLAGRDVTFLTTCARNHSTWVNEVAPGARRIDGLEVVFFPVDGDRDTAGFLRAQASIGHGRGIDPATEAAWLRNGVNSRALCAYLGEKGRTFERIVTGPYPFALTHTVCLQHPDRTILVPCLHDEPFAHLSFAGNMLRAVRRCMFNTVPERDLAIRLYGLDPASVSVVGLGLEQFACDPEPFRSARGLPADYVIYCGRREPGKGTPLLLDYMTVFRQRTGKDVSLVLTGTGAVDVPREIPGVVLDLGHLPEQGKYDAMAGAVAFCHPSVNESLGIVILEAWFAGTPCLVHAGSDVLRYQCRSSNGGLWFRSYLEFEEELLLLLENRGLRDAMGKAGSEYVLREYSWDVVEPRLLEAVEG